jgi:uncharacterized protein (UPF0332 family)
MTKADTALASAHILLDSGDADGAVSRAYYAMFDAARAAIEWAKLSPLRQEFKSHSGLISYFGLHLIKTGRLPVDIGRAINRVQELRSIADYLAEPVPLDKAAQAVKDADTFLAAIHVFITNGS